MKKFLLVFALVLFTSSFAISCTAEDVVVEDELYDTRSEDKDEEEDKG